MGGVGVCTYGGPPPSLLPDGCTASADGTSMTCAGGTSPEPGCARVNALCCLSQLGDTFSRLAQYHETHPFGSLSFTCSGNFGGGDAVWARQFGVYIKAFTKLTALHLDLSFNTLAADNIIDAVSPPLEANPGLTNLSITLAAANLSDAGAGRLGQVVRQGYRGSTLTLDVSRNDPGDLDNTERAITATGAGALADAVGAMSGLKSLTLSLHSNINVTAAGIGRVSAGLAPLKDTLEYLNLDFAYVAADTNNFPVNNDPDRYFACLGRSVGAFTKLRTFVLDTDCDVNDDSTVYNLGIHLACLPNLPRIILPGMDNDQTACHCGIALDKTRNCLVPNKYHRDALGTACFVCNAAANATACDFE